MCVQRAQPVNTRSFSAIRLCCLSIPGRRSFPVRELLGYSLWVKRGGLSLTSESLTVTVVVPDNPPRWPPMSLAWSKTRNWSWVSLSMSGTAVRRIPSQQTNTHYHQGGHDEAFKWRENKVFTVAKRHQMTIIYLCGTKRVF